MSFAICDVTYDVEPEVALKVYQEARELISDKSRWTTEAFSRGPNGDPAIDPNDGVAWCARGAAWKVMRDHALDFEDDLSGGLCILNTIADEFFPCDHEIDYLNEESGIAHINDFHGHGETLEVIDTAIEFLKEIVNAGA